MKRIVAVILGTTFLVAYLPVLAQDAKEAPKAEVKAPAEVKVPVKVEVKAVAKPVAKTPVEVKAVARAVTVPAEPAPVAVPVAEPALPASRPAAVAKADSVSLDPAVDAPWWKVLLRYGLELIFTILGLLASVLVTVLMRKYGFENYTAKVDDLLARGVGLAEQKSIQALKLNGKPLDGAEKLALALDFVASKAKEYKLPEKGKDWWTQKVEGWLGVQKLSGGK